MTAPTLAASEMRRAVVCEEGLGGVARLAVHGRAVGVTFDARLVVPRVEHANSVGVHSASGLYEH